MNIRSMENQNQTLLNNFYSAFARHDGQKMAESYHAEAIFSDPAFGKLRGDEIGMMWKMLIGRSGGNLEIAFWDVKADENQGTANWTAKYVFGKTGRSVANHIHARFAFKDGLIFRHIDDFSFDQWAKQALGWKGWLLGRTNFLQDKVRQQARQSLENYIKRHRG